MSGDAEVFSTLPLRAASSGAGRPQLRSTSGGPPHLAWILTATMSVAALVLLLLLAPRWRAQAADALAAQAAHSAHSARTAPSRPSGGHRDPAASDVDGGRVASTADLPDARLVDRRLTVLTRQARRLGVEVRSVAESIDSSGHLQLAHGLRAEYPALRRFVAAALAADPALSLDQLRAERASEDDNVLEIQLRWTFWQRPPAGEPHRD